MRLTGDILKILLHEKSNRDEVRKLVLNAFKEGFVMFWFELTVKGRTFDGKGALPEDADEKDAVEFADNYFLKMRKIAQAVMLKQI